MRVSGRPDPWRIVLALGITQITAWGSVYYGFAVLLPHLYAELGVRKEWVVGAFSLALLVSGLLAPWIGRQIDRRGGRCTMTAGSVAGGLGLIALSRVDSLAALYGVWLLLGASMAATLYEPAFTVIARSFAANYRRAISVLTLFGGFASTVFWPLAQLLIDQLGWRDATAILGALNLLVCAPLHALMLPTTRARTAPAAPALTSQGSQDVEQALRNPAFYFLCAAFTCNALVFSAMAVHMLPMLTDKGLTPIEAAMVGAMVGPMQVLGRITELLFSQRFTALQIGTVSMSLLPLSLLVFYALGPVPTLFLVFAFLYGAGNGVTTIVRGAVPADVFGRQHYGAINGAMALPVLVAKAIGPVAAALVWALSGGYANLPLVLTAVAAVSVVCFLYLVRNQRRLTEVRSL